MPIEQLSLFDYLEKEIKTEEEKNGSQNIIPYEVGDKVKVHIKVNPRKTQKVFTIYPLKKIKIELSNL